MRTPNTSPAGHGNRVLLAAAAAAAAALLSARPALAQTFDANAAFVANENNAATETSSTFGPFTVGYGNAVDDAPFAAFTPAEHTNAFAGNASTQGFLTNNNVIVPAVVVNVSPSDAGFAGLQPGEILLHPGGRGPNGFDPPILDATLRFTAPTATSYALNGAFRSLDAGSTNNYVLVNGVPQAIGAGPGGSITDAGAFALTLNLGAGDTVDFAVNEAADGIGSDSTGLRARLTAGARIGIVNIDFNGSRPGDTSPVTYVGQGAAGGGTVFNGLAADSTGGNDNLTVTGTNLQDDAGTPTDIDFSIGPVGGDTEPSQGNEPAALFDDYVFNNSAGNVAPNGSPFSITGLGDAASADLYFYLASFNGGTITVSGAPGAGTPGTFNGLPALFFDDVPVSGGAINGVFGANGATGVLSGLTVVTTVPIPEPTAAAAVVLGAAALLPRRRRA